MASPAVGSLSSKEVDSSFHKALNFLGSCLKCIERSPQSMGPAPLAFLELWVRHVDMILVWASIRRFDGVRAKLGLPLSTRLRLLLQIRGTSLVVIFQMYPSRLPCTLIVFCGPNSRTSTGTYVGRMKPRPRQRRIEITATRQCDHRPASNSSMVAMPRRCDLRGCLRPQHGV